MATNIRLSHLLWLYTLVPIVVAVAYLDKVYLNSVIKVNTPFQPEYWIAWVYIFGLPHVIAGLQIFAEKECLRSYGWRLLRVFLFFIALVLGFQYFGLNYALSVIFMAFIMHHTIAQQFGLTLVALRSVPGFFFYLWKWSSVSMVMAIYWMLYSPPVALILIDTNGLQQPLLMFIPIVLGTSIFACASLMVCHRSNSIGVMHVFLNTMLIAAEFYLFSEGYYCFVIILGRLIHELTAWPIYSIHDNNKHLAGKKNLLYGWLNFTKLPVWVRSFILAFCIGSALTFVTREFPVLQFLIVSLSFFHYYSESFLWRRGGILRRHLHFSV